MNIARIRRLVGRLIRFPKEVYYTLNGWRFAELKLHMNKSVTRNDDAIIAATEILNLLDASPSARNPKIAVVTCLPPDETGIAIYSLRHIVNFEGDLDVFSTVKDVPHFLRNKVHVRKRTSDRVHIHPISSLLAFNENAAYDNVIFVLGNSDHNLEIFKAMESFIGCYGGGNATCYMHDPCCHNIVQSGKGFSAAAYQSYLERLYETPGRLMTLADDLTPWMLHANAVKAGYYGVRAILDMGVRSFLVNSKAAESILYNDIHESDRATVTIKTLFHPVFDLEPGVTRKNAAVPSPNKPLTIGTFGGANYGKGTDITISAAKKLRASGREVSLLVAGYGAKLFVDHHFMGAPPDWITCLEPALERDLQMAMASCDIAIQLRRESLGESSGVVPLLIGLRVPTIVSSVGAFVEYGDAVVVAPDNDPDTIVDYINAGEFPTVAQMDKYSDAHSLGIFEELFRRHVLAGT